MAKKLISSPFFRNVYLNEAKAHTRYLTIYETDDSNGSTKVNRNLGAGAT